jgi:hypothetical protein
VEDGHCVTRATRGAVPCVCLAVQRLITVERLVESSQVLSKAPDSCRDHS